MTAMGESIPTLFAAHPSQDWVLDWALQMVNDEGRPYVNSISYGWVEIEQCQIATNSCSAFGYDSVQYVTRTDQEFQMLG